MQILEYGRLPRTSSRRAFLWKELRVLSYDDLENRTILSTQEVFHARLLFFTFNLLFLNPFSLQFIHYMTTC